MKKNKQLGQDVYEPLSDDELEMLKAAQDSETDRSTLPPHDNSDMAKAKRYVKKNKWSVIFVLATVILILAVITALVILLVKNIKESPSTNDYEITLLGVEKDEVYTVPYSEAMIDDVFYLDVIKLAKYAELIVSGEQDRIKITCADGSYVRFENGATTATVNGTRVTLGGKAIITKADSDSPRQCIIPFVFIEKLFSHPLESNTPGLRTVFSKKTNSITVGRAKYAESGTPLPIGFDAKCFESAEEFQGLALKELYPSLSFACVKKTKLVNKSNHLGENYIPSSLLSLNDLGCPVVSDGRYELVSEAAYSLKKMMSAMEEAIDRKGSVLVTSAYRSYAKQRELFEGYVSELTDRGASRAEAEDEVLKIAAKAGFSEHQTGLCVDFIEKGKLELDVSFEKCKAFDWLYENSHKYGFVLRYPIDKVQITGYSYEPWHFRFVGIDAATVMHEDNLCLEEYLAQQQKII